MKPRAVCSVGTGILSVFLYKVGLTPLFTLSQLAQATEVLVLLKV